ncbi:hypothetical protein [Hymenobacter psoromatis]|uniref:hypothetical protein n=1 Tax=Hymenobacter psoromatis TaxID=1484116 RepID=UPI001CBCE3CB|nr:hypothetical protein [Hymenobacter psoromatis]
MAVIRVLNNHLTSACVFSHKNPVESQALWFSAIAATCAVAGHFIGEELSPVAGFITTPIGLLIGFLIGKIIAQKRLLVKLIVVGSPLLLLRFVVFYESKNPAIAIGNYKGINGIWKASDGKEVFTLMVNDTTSLLSVEPGLKNVRYQARIEKGNLILSAAEPEDNKLVWHIIFNASGAPVLDAGGGLLFSKLSR